MKYVTLACVVILIVLLLSTTSYGYSSEIKSDAHQVKMCVGWELK